MNKSNDINLFKAASKADTKIQTGISKSFIYLLIGIVAVIGIGVFVVTLFAGVNSLNDEITVYEGYQTYTASVNVLTNKINEDLDLFNQIQSDIDAAEYIKELSKSSSCQYPGLTNNQKAIIFSKSYLDSFGVEQTGCVPEGIIVDSASQIGIKTYMTDGIKEYTDIPYDLEFGTPETIVFPKGYMLIVFQVAPADFTTAPLQYINNIDALASGAFSEREALEYGYMALPTEENREENIEANSNYVVYIKARLKNLGQILMEDQVLNDATVQSLAVNGYTGSIVLTSDIPLNQTAQYLEGTGLFEEISFNGMSIEIQGGSYVYSGTIGFRLREVE